MQSGHTDWEMSRRLARLPGLRPDNVSYLFKMMHEILPTQECKARTSLRISVACPVPGCGNIEEALTHRCRSRRQIGGF